MALIKCTECGKEFSDKAAACPNCGCPTEAILESIDSAEKKEDVINNSQETEITEKTVPLDEAKVTSEEKEIEPKAKNKKNGKIIGIAVGIAVIVAVAGFCLTKNSRDYTKAQELIEKEKFEEALGILEELNGYEDSAKLIEQCSYELTVDGQFMRSLSKGLMARWDKSDEYAAEGIIGEDPDIYKEYCQIELDMVEQFYEMTFDDQNLQTDARQYIEYLREAQDATKQYTINYTAYSEKWARVYANRTILLQKMVSEYGLVVDEAHQEVLDGMMVDAEAAAEEKKVRADIDAMCTTFEIITKEDEWGYKSYSLKMKNTTDLTFEYFYVDANVVDGNGNIITSGQGGNLESWKPGVEANGDFWIDNQDINIKDYKVEFTPHYSAGSYYQ